LFAFVVKIIKIFNKKKKKKKEIKEEEIMTIMKKKDRQTPTMY